MTPSQFARICRAAADEADRIAAEEREEKRDWVDQSGSPLKRHHCGAVRRVVAAGGEAAIIGRRHLLSPAALRAELDRLTKRGSQNRHGAADSPATELRAQLGLVAGGRR
jgi:hypothetical protein